MTKRLFFCKLLIQVHTVNMIKESKFKVVDSCWNSSTEWSDTFRSFFVYGKKQESRKKKYHNRAKKFHLPEEV